MNVKLDPPPVQLPPDVERRVRAHLMSAVTTQATAATQTPVRRHWAPALVATTAVTAVVAGGLVVADRLRTDKDAPVAGGELYSLDAGPATEAERQQTFDKCLGHAKQPAGQIVWGRRFHDFSGPAPRVSVVIAVRTPVGRASGDWMTCILPESSPYASGMGTPIGRRTALPTAGHPLVPIDGVWQGGAIQQGPLADPTGWTVVTRPKTFAVHSSVARLESRLTWKGGSGPWSGAALADGFAHTAARTALETGRSVAESVPVMRSLKVEYRAFDAAGRPIPIG